jgi:hypothetical protein
MDLDVSRIVSMEAVIRQAIVDLGSGNGDASAAGSADPRRQAEYAVYGDQIPEQEPGIEFYEIISAGL